MIWGGLILNAGNTRQHAMPQAAGGTNAHTQPEDTRGDGFLEKLAENLKRCNPLWWLGVAKAWSAVGSEAPHRFGWDPE